MHNLNTDVEFWGLLTGLSYGIGFCVNNIYGYVMLFFSFEAQPFDSLMILFVLSLVTIDRNELVFFI